MVCRLARHVSETLGAIVALAAVPGAACAQSEQADEKERIAEEILAAQSQEGPRSPALIQLLTELGVLYETEDQYALATAAFEQARGVVRANYGLFTLEQVPLMQQALANQQAIGNFPMVRALEEQLLDLARRNPGDLRSAAIHRDAGLRASDVLRRFLAGEAPTEVYPEVGLYSFLRDDMIRSLVAGAQIHYADAAAVILRNGLYASDELRDLEAQIVRATNVAHEPNARGYRVENERSYNPALAERNNTLLNLASRAGLKDAPAALQEATEGPHRGPMTSPYQIGRDSYYRVIAYDEAVLGGGSTDEASLRNRLQAYLQIADWDLLYSQNGVAFDQYARVHGLLKTADSGEALIAELFAPPIPIVLPTFEPNPLETQESRRYIDVTFEVTKYGESRRVEIAGAAPNVAKAEKDDLVSVVKRARFRPRVADGELGRPSPIVVRYYLPD